MADEGGVEEVTIRRGESAIGDVLLDIMKIQKQKGSDYSAGGAWSANFVNTAKHLGIKPWEAGEFNMAQKMHRLSALRESGRDPNNESIADTYLDLAVYGVLTLALHREFAIPKHIQCPGVYCTHPIHIVR